MIDHELIKRAANERKTNHLPQNAAAQQRVPDRQGRALQALWRFDVGENHARRQVH